MSRRSPSRTVLLVLFLVITALFTGSANAATPTTALTVGEAASCQQILSRAINSLHDACVKQGRNSACYGSNMVFTNPVPNTSLNFSRVGDIELINKIKELATSAFDEKTGTWGLSLLKLQANIPDTMPGQNVLFLVYGETNINNMSGDMQSFYFSSGLGESTCKAVPNNGILVRSPNHTLVTFTANGVHITIASTIVLTATPYQSMSVQLIEGHALVSTNAGSQTLMPGQFVTITMGGYNGLESVGAPSAPALAPASPSTQTLLSTANNLPSAQQTGAMLIGGGNGQNNGNSSVTSGQSSGSSGNDGSDDGSGNGNHNGNGNKGGKGNGKGNGNGNGNGNGGDNNGGNNNGDGNNGDKHGKGKGKND